MYKLVIIDDEPTELRFLRYIVNKRKLPFYICGEGENGCQALELVEKYRPEFVIMDIYMPLMDGLEAAAQIKRRYPATRVYILTAYEHFEYAHKAIKIDVEDYLLKPITPDQLVDVLKKGIAKSLRQKLELCRKERLLRQVQQMKPAYKRQTVYDFISDTNTTGIGMRPGNEINPCSVIVASAWGEDGQLLQGAEMEALAKELDMSAGTGLSAVLPQGEVVVLCRARQTEAMRDARRVVENWKMSFQANVAGGLASVSSEGNVAIAFQQADIVCRTALFWQEPGVFTPGESPGSADLPDTLLLQREILNAILERQVARTENMMVEMVEKLGRAHCPPEQAVAFSTEVIALVLRDASEQIISTEEANVLRKRMDETLSRVSTAHQLENALKQLAGDLCNLAYSECVSAAEKSVKWAVEYIHQNYHQDLTLEIMAKKLFLSPCYFSRVFKRYTGEGFAGYLVSVRLKKAKNLLLTGKFTVAEVARRVGFNDQGYFSNVFKKHHHLSPSQLVNSVTKQES